MMKSVFASVFPESSRKVLEPKHTGILDPDVGYLKIYCERLILNKSIA
jgi:hypothetical protein